MILRSTAQKIVLVNHRGTETQSFTFFILMSLCLCGSFIITLFLSHLAFAADTSTLQRQGVKAYQTGNYEQALELFSQAVDKEPDDASGLYNQGTALYKLERFDEASQAFSASAGRNTNQKSRARAEYNQGRALLAEAAKNHEANKKKELLLASNQAFQQALRDDPRLMAARKGIEDFRQEYAKLSKHPPQKQQVQDQKQQDEKGQDQGQQEPGSQGQGQQDLQNQLSEAGQQQQDMANQSKAASSGQGQDGASQEQREEMAAQQQSVRQSLEQIKEELKKNPQGQDGGQENKELTKELDQAIKAQKKAEEALKKGDLDQAQNHQQQAADNLRELAADQKDKSAQTGNATDDKKDAESQDIAATAKDQESEPNRDAEKTASTVADILDGEKALHEMRRLRMQQQRPSSGKDW